MQRENGGLGGRCGALNPTSVAESATRFWLLRSRAGKATVNMDVSQCLERPGE